MPVPAGSKYPNPETLRWKRPMYDDTEGIVTKHGEERSLTTTLDGRPHTLYQMLKTMTRTARKNSMTSSGLLLRLGIMMKRRWSNWDASCNRRCLLLVYARCGASMADFLLMALAREMSSKYEGCFC
jgi:hypothetical protein